ncbi:MAG: type II secretion system protein [Candidatus Paceibacterota bacterium]|jgi:prepilin-type N-terminal cleavage/methylation domain-containing protein
MLKDNSKFNKGFTLVEMLVAIAVFMIVMTVAVGSLVSIIDANRKAQAIKNVVNNINFALESISKDMRVGTNFFCLTNALYNNGTYTSGEYVNDEDACKIGSVGVGYKKEKNKYVYYRFFPGDSSVLGEKGNIRKCVSSSFPDCNDWESITAPAYNVQITSMKFYVLGADTLFDAAGVYTNKSKTQDSWRQPRVIIALEGTAGIKDNVKTTFNIQTTVSQRIREIH